MGALWGCFMAGFNAGQYIGGDAVPDEREKERTACHDRPMIFDRVKCSVCGGDEVVSYATPEMAVCPACCPHHVYEYERAERSYFCQYCGVQASDEWIADRVNP